MAADNGSAGTLIRYTAGTDSARPKNGALARQEYGLLELMGMTVNPANAGDPGSADSHGETGEQARQD